MEVDEVPETPPWPQFTYPERVVLGLYSAEKDYKRSPVHDNRLRCYIKRNALQRQDKLGAYANTYIRRAVGRFKSAGAIELYADENRAFNLSPAARRKVDACFRKYQGKRAVKEAAGILLGKRTLRNGKGGGGKRRKGNDGVGGRMSLRDMTRAQLQKELGRLRREEEAANANRVQAEVQIEAQVVPAAAPDALLVPAAAFQEGGMQADVDDDEEEDDEDFQGGGNIGMYAGVLDEDRIEDRIIAPLPARARSGPPAAPTHFPALAATNASASASNSAVLSSNGESIRWPGTLQFSPFVQDLNSFNNDEDDEGVEDFRSCVDGGEDSIRAPMLEINLAPDVGAGASASAGASTSAPVNPEQSLLSPRASPAPESRGRGNRAQADGRVGLSVTSTSLTPLATPAPATHIPQTVFSYEFTFQCAASVISSAVNAVSGLVSRGGSPSPSNGLEVPSQTHPIGQGGLLTPNASPLAARNGTQNDVNEVEGGGGPLPALNTLLAASTVSMPGGLDSEMEDVDMADETTTSQADFYLSKWKFWKGKAKRILRGKIASTRENRQLQGRLRRKNIKIRGLEGQVRVLKIKNAHLHGYMDLFTEARDSLATVYRQRDRVLLQLNRTRGRLTERNRENGILINRIVAQDGIIARAKRAGRNFFVAYFFGLQERKELSVELGATRRERNAMMDERDDARVECLIRGDERDDWRNKATERGGMLRGFYTALGRVADHQYWEDSE